MNGNKELEVGLIHEAIWGGKTIEYGYQPQRFSDYLRIVFARPAGKSGFKGEKVNTLGNHLGVWDISLTKKYILRNYKFYYQHPFEDKSGAFQYFFDELKKRKFPKNSFDGLFGFEVNNKGNKFFSKFLYEHLNTMFQSGPLSASKSDSTYGRDNYYNHYIYQSGWTYMSRVIGNPLFTVGKSKIKDQIYIVNNRIKAHHIGIYGYFNYKFKYKILLTQSKNYGTYDNQEKLDSFYEGINQISALLQLDFLNIYKKINIQVSYGIDRGKFLKDNDGFQFSINYNLKNLSLSQ